MPHFGINNSKESIPMFLYVYHGLADMGQVKAW